MSGLKKRSRKTDGRRVQIVRRGDIRVGALQPGLMVSGSRGHHMHGRTVGVGRSEVELTGHRQSMILRKAIEQLQARLQLSRALKL